MSLFSATEIGDLALLQASALPDTATLQRTTLGPDGQGGTTEQVVTSAVACRYAPESPIAIERPEGGTIQSITHWLFTFPIGTAVAPRDRIAIGPRTWEVSGLLSPSSWQSGVRVRCTEVGV